MIIGYYKSAGKVQHFFMLKKISGSYSHNRRQYRKHPAEISGEEKGEKDACKEKKEGIADVFSAQQGQPPQSCYPYDPPSNKRIINKPCRIDDVDMELTTAVGGQVTVKPSQFQSGNKVSSETEQEDNSCK